MTPIHSLHCYQRDFCNKILICIILFLKNFNSCLLSVQDIRAWTCSFSTSNFRLFCIKLCAVLWTLPATSATMYFLLFPLLECVYCPSLVSMVDILMTKKMSAPYEIFLLGPLQKALHSSTPVRPKCPFFHVFTAPQFNFCIWDTLICIASIFYLIALTVTMCYPHLWILLFSVFIREAAQEIWTNEWMN